MKTLVTTVFPLSVTTLVFGQEVINITPKTVTLELAPQKTSAIDYSRVTNSIEMN